MTHPQDKPSSANRPERSASVDVDAGEASAAEDRTDGDGLWRRLFGPSGGRRFASGQYAEHDRVLHFHDLSGVSRWRLAVDGQLWDDLLAGRTSRLQPCHAAANVGVVFDPDLDEAQRDAVHRALSCPDIFLIQGAPGVGKSRVLAEVVRCAVHRGERVLVTGPAAGGIDAVLERVAQDENILAVRWQPPYDGGLPATVRQLTPDRLASRLAERCRVQAKQSALDAAARIRLAEQHLHAAEELCRTAAQWQEICRQLEEIHLQRQQLLPWTLGAPPGENCPFEDPGFIKLRKEEEKRHAAAVREVEAQLEAARRTCADKRREFDAWAAKVKAQAYVVEVKRCRRFHTWTWWKTLLQGRASERLTEFECRCREAEEEWREAEQGCQALEEAAAQEKKRHEDAVRQLQRGEAVRRLAALDCRAGELDSRRQSLEAGWSAKLAGLPESASMSATPSLASADAAHAQAQAELAESRRAASAAERWLAAQQTLAADLSVELLELAQVVAAPADAVAADPRFSRRRFDLAVVDDADWLGEAELRQLSARADRLVLAGRPRSAGSAAGPASAKEPLFARLWRSLHCDPRDLPYQWIEEGEQLICRLEPVPAEERFRLEREPVADHPEVELRIWAPSDMPPRLAEVVFPKALFSIVAAKRFLYHQLQALAIRPGSACLRWRVGGQSLLFEAGSAAAHVGDEVSVPLEDGVREIIQPSSDAGRRSPTVYWSTLRLEFDLGAGWDPSRAAQWLWERCGLRDLGRTSYLHVVYRPHPDLARFCVSVLPDAHVVVLPPAKFIDANHALRDLVSPGVQVVASAPPRAGLKPLNRGGISGRNGPFSPETPPIVRLSDASERRWLPAHLQSRLPHRGSVFPGEAEVILGRLRALELAAVRRGNNPRPAQIAVLAWQPEQAEMLRLLWESTPANDRPFDVVFSTPRGFRGCEADLVFLSLSTHADPELRSDNGKPADHSGRVERVAGVARGTGVASGAGVAGGPPGQASTTTIANSGEPYDSGDLADWRTALNCARRSLLLVGDPAQGKRSSGKPPGCRSSAEAAFLARMLKAVEELNRRPQAAKACEGISA